MTSIASLSVLAAASGRLGQAEGPVIPWLRIVLAFLFCIALAVAAVLWLRKRQGLPPLLAGLIATAPDGPDRLGIEERLRVSATSQILVLRWDGARYLVHVSGAGAQLLDRRAP